MAKGGRIYHWKHGWIPISPEARAYVAGRGPKPEKGKRSVLQLSMVRSVMNPMAGLSSSLRDRDPSPDLNEGNARIYLAAGMPMVVRRSTMFPNMTDAQIAEYLHTKQSADKLIAKLHEGGFTFDARKGGIVEIGSVKGVAVAVPGTEQIVGNGDMTRNDFIDGMAKVIEKHSEELANGAFLGGWYSEDRDAYMVELTELVPSREDAVRLGKERNQEGVFDLGTGEYISTGGSGG